VKGFAIGRTAAIFFYGTRASVIRRESQVDISLVAVEEFLK
jgi:hypothetical protein